jgi:uncharacterized protein (UPF0332 family)
MLPIAEARKLFESAESETQFRTAASRAYFAAFNWIIEFAKARGFVEQKSSEDHRRLIDFLKSSGSETLRRIGHHRLPRLRKLRNHADYVHDAEFTHGMAEEAVTDAENVIQLLGGAIT